MCSQRATSGSDQPWLSAESTTTKNTALKIWPLLGTPASKGKVASVIGTAPLRPTQERKLSSRRRKRNGHTEAQTAIGRATRISTRAISRPSQATASRRLGKLSSPSITNSTICPSQAMASWKEKMPRRNTMVLLPSTMPAM